MGLEVETERCKHEAEEEGGKIVKLRQVLERERKRRKRYEHYEELAADVNRKKSRADSQAESDLARAEIARLKRQHSEVETLVEQRNQRAQLLRDAVAELKLDLQREQLMSGEVISGGAGEFASGTGKSSGG